MGFHSQAMLARSTHILFLYNWKIETIKTLYVSYALVVDKKQKRPHKIKPSYENKQPLCCLIALEYK